jgi:hypothetical protein
MGGVGGLAGIGGIAGLGGQGFNLQPRMPEPRKPHFATMPFRAVWIASNNSSTRRRWAAPTAFSACTFTAKFGLWSPHGAEVQGYSGTFVIRVADRPSSAERAAK